MAAVDGMNYLVAEPFLLLIRKGKVPDVLIATIEPPAGMAITGRGCLIQARLCRPKRDESRGDQQAKEVSDGLPFLEYELHRQLINKLRIKGMNAIFGLRVSLPLDAENGQTIAQVWIPKKKII